MLTTYLFYENTFQNITYIVNIAGEWDLENFDNLLTNNCSENNYDNREHMLASRICMYAGVLFKTDMYPASCERCEGYSIPQIYSNTHKIVQYMQLCRLIVVMDKSEECI